MKNLLRQCVGLGITLPFGLAVWMSSPFIGRERAVEFWGPVVTFVAKYLVLVTLPRGKDTSEFERFGPTLKANLKFWRPVYDCSVEYPDQDTVKLNITNCPFCETFDKLKLPELSPFVCQGDWKAAESNANKWEFERKHQIGTGDEFCDHTYKRLRPSS